MKRNIFAVGLLAAASLFADKVSYGYDDAGRLAKADYGNGRVITYTYDKAGNLLNRTVAGTGTAPVITAAGFVNAASFKGGTVAPGEMVTVFGTGIGPSTLAGYQIANNVVSGSVAATRILFDGTAAPVIYVSAGQSTVMVPYGIANKASTQVVAEYQGVQSAPLTLNVAAAAPGLFTLSQNGLGPAAVVNQDGSINGASAPAPKGSVILIYLTGDGQTNPGGVDGQLALTTFPRTAGAVSVTIGNVPATVLYSGVAPQSIAGFSQFNVTVPDAAPSGSSVSLVITVGGIASQAGVTIAVK